MSQFCSLLVKGAEKVISDWLLVSSQISSQIFSQIICHYGNLEELTEFTCLQKTIILKFKAHETRTHISICNEIFSVENKSTQVKILM